jgi:hypothetical protein
MKKVRLGAVIAERALRSSKVKREVHIKIGCPQKTPADDFIVPYQIVGAGDEEIRFAAGLDSIQALQLVFQMISADIHLLDEYDFKWADADDSGFPVP